MAKTLFYHFRVTNSTWKLKIPLSVTSLNMKNKKFHFELLTQTWKIKISPEVTNSMFELIFFYFELLTQTWKFYYNIFNTTCNNKYF